MTMEQNFKRLLLFEPKNDKSDANTLDELSVLSLKKKGKANNLD